jgi:adenine-specific DNA-methyltransferase
MPTLHWLTRDADLQTAGRAPYRLLEPVAELSSGDPAAENMLIQGDNLAALKALLPFYAGRVKCIYIDPPYNTRSAFAHYDDNLEHSQWLAMIYPRLALLRDLLAEDGSIWVSIDDNEGHYLKVVMDEVFGRGNFVAHIVWQKTHTRENRTDFATVHDTILLFAKNRQLWKEIRNPLPASENQIERYENPDNDPRGPWASLPAHAKAEKGRRQAQFFTVTTPSGRKVDPPAGRCWLYTEPRFAEMVADNRIWFGIDGENVPRVKKFLSEVQSGLVPSTLWMHSEVGTSGSAKSEITTLFPGDVPFSTPKPEHMLYRIIHVATNPGDLVLDSFLGSGTTAAVAHKMGRRYIGIELGEHAVTHCVPRLRKVIAGEGGGISAAVGWQGGGGFRFYRLGEPVFDAQGRINPAIRFEHLAAHVWFAETRTPLDLAQDPKGFGNPSGLTSGLTPLLGIHRGIAYYLLYNGVLGDRRPAGGNVLTRGVLAGLPPFAGPKVIYGESCRLSAETLRAAGVMFKQIPYDLKAR